MIELSMMWWVLAIFFAIAGWVRGWNKELVATAGIVLGLFALFQFDTLLRGTILLNVSRDQTLFVQIAIFMVILFFAYQTRMVIGGDGRRNPMTLQESILGALLGFLNGYLVWGSLWYFMDINEYPWSTLITAPAPTSSSANAIGLLPLVVVGGGAGGTGDLLAVAVVVLFLVVLIMM
jgi:hypothetical protein